jgi:ferric-dicitrate binding protein FerR (iron transport regulator)
VAVVTPLGTVRHLGTQFEVRLLDPHPPAARADGALRVTVREGMVEVRRDERSYQAAAGAVLTLRAGGAVERDVAQPQGAPWEWTQRAAPPLPIEGTTLATFLAWVSRETGLPWRYADGALEESTHATLLHGSIEGLTPEEALAVVLPGCGMRHRRSDRALLLEPAPP